MKFFLDFFIFFYFRNFLLFQFVKIVVFLLKPLLFWGMYSKLKLQSKHNVRNILQLFHFFGARNFFRDMDQRFHADVRHHPASRHDHENLIRAEAGSQRFHHAFRFVHMIDFEIVQNRERIPSANANSSGKNRQIRNAAAGARTAVRISAGIPDPFCSNRTSAV